MCRRELRRGGGQRYAVAATDRLDALDPVEHPWRCRPVFVGRAAGRSSDQDAAVEDAAEHHRDAAVEAVAEQCAGRGLLEQGISVGQQNHVIVVSCTKRDSIATWFI